MTIDTDKITDAQAAEIMLTLPWQFGDVNEDGEAAYSDDEIQTVIGYVRKINARAETAEAENKRLRDVLRTVRRKLARDERMAALDAVDTVLKGDDDG